MVADDTYVSIATDQPNPSNPHAQGEQFWNALTAPHPEQDPKDPGTIQHRTFPQFDPVS